MLSVIHIISKDVTFLLVSWCQIHILAHLCICISLCPFKLPFTELVCLLPKTMNENCFENAFII